MYDKDLPEKPLVLVSYLTPSPTVITSKYRKSANRRHTIDILYQTCYCVFLHTPNLYRSCCQPPWNMCVVHTQLNLWLIDLHEQIYVDLDDYIKTFSCEGKQEAEQMFRFPNDMISHTGIWLCITLSVLNNCMKPNIVTQMKENRGNSRTISCLMKTSGPFANRN